MRVCARGECPLAHTLYDTGQSPVILTCYHPIAMPHYHYNQLSGDSKEYHELLYRVVQAIWMDIP